MSKAGYCSACNENVYLNEDGSCIKGHPTNCISGVYDVPDAGAVAAPAAVGLMDSAVAEANTTAQKKQVPKGVVIGAIIGVVLLCGVIANLAGGGESDTPSTPAAVEQPEAAQPEPTAVEPDESDSAPTASEQAYAIEVATISENCGEALSSLGTVLTEDPAAVFVDDEVKAEVLVYMATVKAGYLAAKELDPPARMEGVHADFLAALKLYDQSMDKLAQGIDDIDEEKIGESMDLMMQASAKLESASAKMNALQ